MKKFFKIVILLGVLAAISVAALGGIGNTRQILSVAVQESPTAVLEIIGGEMMRCADQLREKFGVVQEEARVAQENTSNTDRTIDGFYYKQLNPEAQMIYNAFENNREQMKSGTYLIELGDEFSKVLEKNGGQEMLNDSYQSAVEAYVYDNPEIFYLDTTHLYLNVETTVRGNYTTYRVYIDNGKQPSYLTETFDSADEVNQTIEELESAREQILSNATGDDYEDIRMVHDYLVDHIEYETTLSKPEIFSIYGALINQEAVCEGYAKTFQYLVEGLDIPCLLISGRAPNPDGELENHAWNYVKLDGRWYAVDVTWDDPVVDDTLTAGLTKWTYQTRYFLKGEESFSKDHTPDGQLTKDGMAFVYPELSQEDYSS